MILLALIDFYDSWSRLVFVFVSIFILFNYLIFLTVVIMIYDDTDRVFPPACSTQKVYDEGAKDVALSALSGINGNLIRAKTLHRDFFLLSDYCSFGSIQQFQFSCSNNFCLRAD